MVWLELGFLGLCQFNNSKMLQTSTCSIGEHQVTISSAEEDSSKSYKEHTNAHRSRRFQSSDQATKKGEGGINSDLHSFLDFNRYFLGKLLSRFQAELHAAAPEVIVGVELDLSGS